MKSALTLPNTHNSSLLQIYPKGLREQLAWLKAQYGDIDIFISENGYATSGHNLDDFDRIKNMKDHLEQVGANEVSVSGSREAEFNPILKNQ